MFEVPVLIHKVMKFSDKFYKMPVNSRGVYLNINQVIVDWSA